jgi:hypothetical protein
MITMECDYCDHVEHYEDECSFFQGEMWGLPNDSVMCNDCLEKKPCPDNVRKLYLNEVERLT